MKPFAERCTKPELLGEVMKYQPLAHVRTMEHFAEHFCVCTQWRAALPGHTWPNRLYSLAGSSDGALDNPSGGFAFYDLPTVAEVLTAQGVPWAYYKQDVAFLELFRRWTLDREQLRPLGDFLAACAAGKLPRVSWVEPNISDFGAANANDDHPPMSVLRGQAFLRQVYEALRAGPSKNWMLVVTYDEHGGFYESVGPVAAADTRPECRSTGFRVPAFLVSPRIAPRTTYPHPLEHATLIRTILDAYCRPEPIFDGNPRVTAARSLLDVFAADSAIACSPRAELAAIPPGPQLSPEPPAPTLPLWEEFKRAKAVREAAHAPAPAGAPLPPGMAGPSVVGTSGRTSAALEAIHVVARDPAALAVVALDPAVAGWRLERATDDPRSGELVPPTALEVEAGWEAVHQLRRRRELTVAEPVWETEMGLPSPVQDAPTAGPVAEADRWALELVRAFDAWKLPSPSGSQRGAGIVIGQLDTGYHEHAELEAGALLPGYGYDFVDDDPDPRDPLVTGPGLFPGHGTATAGVIASRDAGRLIGTAPEAVVIPLRVSRTVVHLSQRRMTAALRRAVAGGCHVVSISAGGLWSAELHRAVREATRAGVIVVAAAGNYVPFVVWPAAYPEVIACGACDVGLQPWRWSSRGDAVDISAPGVDVPVASVAAGGDSIRPGTGTSYATAMVAGAVATWLSFHGRDRLIAIYGAPELARVARTVLVRSAAALAHDGGGMGAGVLDLAALLAEALPTPRELLVAEPAPALMRPSVASLADAAGLLAHVGAALGTTELSLAGRLSLADELAFHRALERAARVSEPAGAPVPDADPVPARASRALRDGMS